MELKTIQETPTLDQVREVLQKWTAPILSTMGARGSVVMINHESGVISTQDGVTVARYTLPPDPLESAIFRFVRDATEQMVKQVGDGTTTTTCLVLAMIQNYCAQENPENKHDAIPKMKAEVDLILEAMKELRRDIITDGEVDLEALRAVATISCHGNKDLGNLIAELVAKVGEYGDVSVEKSITEETYTEYYDGYVVPSLLLNSNFINNRKGTCTLEDCLIILYDGVIDDENELLEVYEAYMAECTKLGAQKSLVIFCEDIQGSALNTMIGNLPHVGRGKARIPAVAVRAPLSGQRRVELMEDLAEVTGAFVFNKIGGIPLKQIKKDLTRKVFGSALKITADGKKVVLSLDDPDTSDYIAKLKDQLKDADNDSDKKYLEQRISRLTAGLGTVFVGGDSSVENSRTNHLVEDAVLASVQALKHGVVPGGGKALYHAASAGNAGIIAIAATNPMFRLITSYFGRIDIPYSSIDNPWDVFDVSSGKIVDAWEAGIIDPASVPETALKKAFSVFEQLVLTEYYNLLVPKNEPNV